MKGRPRAAAEKAAEPPARRVGDVAADVRRQAADRPAVAPVLDPNGAALALFMRLEAAARDAVDLVELRHLLANETRKLNRARQIFVVEIDGVGRPRVTAISSLDAVNRQSEVVAGVEALVARLGRDAGLAAPVELRLPAYCDPQSALADSYPFPELAWSPLADRNKRVFAGLLFTRDTVWTASEIAVSSRLASVYAHAWRELATSGRFGSRRVRPAGWPLWAAAAALLSLALPVPMTALAPIEIVAASPSVIAAGMDGVIEAVAVDPSAVVKEGDVLVRLSDTTLRNRLEVAEQEVLVAEARVRQATILAFSDPRGRHDLGLAEAELALKRAEHAFARDLLAKTVIRAPAHGIAVYADRKALIGRPVATGERIMEIADPATVEARIDLTVPDAVALVADSTVRLFLDVDPLEPWSGVVVRSDYRAQPSQTDVLAFRAVARLSTDRRPVPRIGLRGTAQVRGATTVLGLYLFRRPLTALRQWIGL